MWHATETNCLKLHPELLFTKYGLSYFMQTKERERETACFRKTFLITLLLATHAVMELLLYFG